MSKSTNIKLLTLLLPAAVVIALDQYTKWLVRTSPELHRWEIVEGWLEFYYTQNSGMAMGIDILPTHVISMISIAATIGIFAYLLWTLKHAGLGYLFFMGLVLGGALGNITDRLIMGYIEGYGGLLDGHVVDFIYFSLQINDWTVFPYIFNVADIAISVSIITLLIFGSYLLPEEPKAEPLDLTEKEGTIKE
ncbi:MAG: signal peptidase II [Bacteroidetes bacterium]|nr:signal peptidase II [Bacteroidota bacterium]MDA1125959.1 signal peptidase II [Bacteroidota bacterium]